LLLNYLDLDEDVGEGVGERDVAEGLQAVPHFLRGGDVGADADAGEASLEPTVCWMESTKRNHEHIYRPRGEPENTYIGKDGVPTVCAMPRDKPMAE
jgi:hypothetical protein